MDTNETDWNFSCDNTRICVLSKFRSTFAVDLVSGILVIPPNIILFLIIPHIRVFTPSLRILLAHFSFLLLWYSIGCIMRAVHILTSPQIGYSIPIRLCQIFETICTGLPAVTIVFSFFALCLQRLYANLAYKTYEKETLVWPSILMIICVWVLSIGIKIQNIIRHQWNETIPVCVVSLGSNNIMLYIQMTCELSALIIGIYIYYYTRHLINNATINRAQFDLSARFQISQNASVNRMLVPGMLLHLVCHIPRFVLIGERLRFYDIMNDTETELSSRISCWVLLVYILIHPILAFYSNNHLKNELAKTNVGKWLNKIILFWKNSTKVHHVPPIRQSHQTTHFNYLDQIWTKERLQKEAAKKKNEKIERRKERSDML